MEGERVLSLKEREEWEEKLIEVSRRLYEALKKDKEKGLEVNFINQIWREKETIWDYLGIGNTDNQTTEK